MAETQRTVAEIYALLADNTTSAISPQDLRDAFESWRPAVGGIYVTVANRGAITIADSTNYFEATAMTWTLSSPESRLFDESAGNGRLTYIGVPDVLVRVSLSVSMTAVGINQLLHFRIGKNATTDDASQITRYVTTGSDIGASATQLLTTLSTGDYVSVWARNETSAGNVNIEVANLQAITVAA
jgi:hypothetical protein